MKKWNIHSRYPKNPWTDCLQNVHLKRCCKVLSFYSASALLAMQTVPGQNGNKPKRRKSKRRHSKTATKGMAKTATNQNASARHQRQIPTGPVRISNTTVLPVSQVRDLGVYLDANVTMKAHVTATVRACFSALRQIRSVRRSHHATPCWPWLEHWWSAR